VRLYVNSFKKAVGTENIVIDKPSVQILSGTRLGNVIRTYPTREVRTITKYEYVLPEQQESLVEIVKEVAFKFGFQLEVIDVGQMDFFDKPLPKEVKAMKNFPVLATESYVQLASDFSREDVERFLSNRTKAGENKPYRV